VSRFPAAFRLPAFASWPSDSRRGVGPSSRSAYRQCRTPTGLPRLARTSCERGGRPLYPEDGGARPAGSPPRPAPAASQRPVPKPRHDIPSCGALLHEASTRVHAIRPSALPLACSARMERAPLGFPSSFAPRRYRRRTSRAGTGHGARTWNYTLNITFRLILQSVVHSMRATFASHGERQGNSGRLVASASSLR
jgi:hypothetical protein